jgi:hypothetical protein
MYSNSNINIPLLDPGSGNQNQIRAKNVEKIQWLKERKIKFSLVFNPVWATDPCAINMRKEDALMFKLAFEP